VSSWSSYPSIFALGHRAIADLLKVEVNCEEKIDGSQFSFGLVEANKDSNGHVVDAVDGYYLFDGRESVPMSLKVRSKGAVIHIEAPPKMFAGVCATVMDLFKQGLLHLGWTYRGEALAKPKHNALSYDRTPKGGIILYDVNTGNQEYLSYEDKAAEAERLGLECVPRLFRGTVANIDAFRAFLDTTSILGGQKIEGVVVKPTAYNLYGTDKKVLFGKFVSEAFKEVHRKAWGDGGEQHKSGKKELVEKIILTLSTPARYQKALIHLKEQDKITGTLRDIGTIIKEVPGDVLKEEQGWIMETLFNALWPEISRGIIRGVPQWYKDLLLTQSFEDEAPNG
jgi:hypothetical protein